MALDGTTEKIRLMSADGQEFEMDAKAANLSETLKNTVEGSCQECRCMYIVVVSIHHFYSCSSDVDVLCTS